MRTCAHPENGVDPFSRRKTRPMNYWTTKRAGGAGAGACPLTLIPAVGLSDSMLWLFVNSGY